MISVAMTTYNGENFIKEQLDSIINQETAVDEIVIYDDCSTDKTVNIIEEIREKNAVPIHLYVNTENVGYIENFRRAIEKTSGDIIFLSDQDDIWHKKKVKDMTSILKDGKVGVLCTQYELIDSNGNQITNKDFQFDGDIQIGNEKVFPITFTKLLFGNIVPGCTYCFTREIKDLYLRNIHNPIIHDYAICLIGAAIGKLYFYNGKTMKYRLHGNNSIGIEKKDEKQKLDMKGRRKPYIIAFLENYYDIMKKSDRVKATLILYFRIPAIRVMCNNVMICFREKLKRG